MVLEILISAALGAAVGVVAGAFALAWLILKDRDKK